MLDDDEIHAGYQYEDGMFSRMRSWVDVFPGLRLARVLRILASPSYVLWVVVACGITRLASILILNLPSRASSETIDRTEGGLGIWLGIWLGDWVGLSQWISNTAQSQRLVPLLVFLLIVIPVWMLTFQIVSRAGAGLTAGKDLPGFFSSLRICMGRLGWSCLVPLVPITCVIGFSIGLVLICLPSLVLDLPWLSTTTGWLAGLSTIPIGVLAFGSLFAIPFALTAMVVEPTPDPMDSVSRGYEYLYRGSLALAGYGFVVLIFVGVVQILIEGICSSASQITAIIFSDYWRNHEFPIAAQQGIAFARLGWMTTMMLASVGGVYLLMRRATCEQEVEDFWEPPIAPSDPLPSLPKETLDQ